MTHLFYVGSNLSSHEKVSKCKFLPFDFVVTKNSLYLCRCMKKIVTCILTILGLTSAYGQKNYEDADVKSFYELMQRPNVFLLDVRTEEEFAEGHIEGAMIIDQKESDFVEKVKAQIPKDKIIAIYCRSGRRSSNAAERLATLGYKSVNLKGGIIEWREAGLPVTTDNYEEDVQP